MIPVKVDQLVLSNMGFVVILKGPEDSLSLPIFIGAAEAQAIAMKVNKIKIPRPMTHDLFKNVLDCLECRLKRTDICDLKEGTFFARLVFERDGMEIPIDARPSDAIALALRFGSPIFVDEAVMKEAGRALDETGDGKDTANKGTAVKGAETKLSHEEILKRDLEKAIGEERYEDAARLRDELAEFKNPHPDN